MSDEPAFSSHLRIVLPGADPTGEQAAAILARSPHAEVVFDPTGEVLARLAADRDRPVSRPAPVGGATDANDPLLAALRQQIVDPVVESLFLGAEVETITVLRGAESRSDVWVQLVARGEPFEQLLYSPVGDSPVGPTVPIDLADVAQNLAWNLEDFVAESRFAWGEQRIARYELPDSHIRDA